MIPFALAEVIYPPCTARPYTGCPCDADAVYWIRLYRLSPGPLENVTLETVAACPACVERMQAIDADRVATLASRARRLAEGGAP